MTAYQLYRQDLIYLVMSYADFLPEMIKAPYARR
ncbi:hypothetical protein Barb6XT_02723 [Bacteroidales bacterium Barb6XT]|nr:hypothetical protein Barb6XT_02723 [Bacteroidales bacterium Barb6XT]